MNSWAPASYLEQHSRRFLDNFLDAFQTSHRFAAIHNAMVISQGDIHHRPYYHAAIARNGAILNRMHAQNTALWRVDDRRGQQRAVNTAVADRKSATDEFLGQQFVFLGTPGEIPNRRFDLGETQALRIAQD